MALHVLGSMTFHRKPVTVAINLLKSMGGEVDFSSRGVKILRKK